MISPTTTSVNSVYPTADSNNNLVIGLQRLAKKNPQLFSSVVSQIQSAVKSNSGSSVSSGRFGYEVKDPSTGANRPSVGYGPNGAFGPQGSSGTSIAPPIEPILMGGPVLASNSGSHSNQIGPPIEPIEFGAPTATSNSGSSSTPTATSNSGSTASSNSGAIPPPSEPFQLGGPTATSNPGNSPVLGAPTQPHIWGGTPTATSTGEAKHAHHGHHSHKDGDSESGSTPTLTSGPASGPSASSAQGITGPTLTSNGNNATPLENSQKLQANVVSGLPIFDRNGQVNPSLIPALTSLFSGATSGSSGTSTPTPAVSTPAGTTVATTSGSRGIDVQA